MKGRTAKATGGANEAEEDVKVKPEARTNAKKIDAEAEEMKKGGRAKKKRGGGLHAHHGGGKKMSDGSAMKVEHVGKEVGVVSGPEPPAHAGKKPRASGGRAAFAKGGSTSDANPFTSARAGKDAPGRKLMKGEMGYGED
jgi:hypothetical protein